MTRLTTWEKDEELFQSVYGRPYPIRTEVIVIDHGVCVRDLDNPPHFFERDYLGEQLERVEDRMDLIGGIIFFAWLISAMAHVIAIGVGYQSTVWGVLAIISTAVGCACVLRRFADRLTRARNKYWKIRRR
jgi:hypothetical protein